MRGRDLFRAVRPCLRASAAILHIVPASLCEFALLMFKHFPTRLGIAVRYVLLLRLARSCGDNVAIFEGVHLFHLRNITFGSHISVHQMCYIDGTGGLAIGSDVAIAHASTIRTTTHSYSDPHQAIRDAACLPGPVEIGNDVWIGAGVRILPKVTIGSRVVVGAGAVVIQDIPSHSVAVGVPARVCKSMNAGPQRAPSNVVALSIR
jgi:acetyltransferase-like isoleucine patch superfamily enzyme